MIASRRLVTRPSCSSSSRKRNPISGAVRTSDGLAPGPHTSASAGPISWRSKSEYGLTRRRSRADTGDGPVLSPGTWHPAQPMAANHRSPCPTAAAHPARNSVMMGALALLQLEQGCIGHGIDEPQAVERWRSEAPRGGGGRRRFAVEPQRPGLRGQLPPDVLSPCLGELVTARRPIEPRCFEHPLTAHAANGGRCVAGAALVLVEGGAEALRGTEDAVEYLRPRPKALPLDRPEAWKRRTGLAGR